MINVQVDKNDSRKYKLSLIALVLIALGWLASSYIPNLKDMFSELTNSIMGILAIYYTGNLGNKFVVAKYIVEQSKVNKSGETNDPGK